VEPCRQKTRTTSVAWRERIQVQNGFQEAPYRKSSHKDFLWRAFMLVRAVQQLGEARALLSEGAAERDLGEFVGPLKEGDTVLRRGSNEIREGTGLKVRLTTFSKG
jgi:hypothetical protein